MTDQHLWVPLLREALVMLSLPAAEQVRLIQPGCLSCEMFEDFDHPCRLALNDPQALTSEQRTLLERIGTTFEAMEPANFTCFDNTVVERPEWNTIREIVNEALRVFGWEQTKIRPFTEVEPGIWKRPAGDV